MVFHSFQLKIKGHYSRVYGIYLQFTSDKVCFDRVDLLHIRVELKKCYQQKISARKSFLLGRADMDFNSNRM